MRPIGIPRPGQNWYPGSDEKLEAEPPVTEPEQTIPEQNVAEEEAEPPVTEPEQTIPEQNAAEEDEPVRPNNPAPNSVDTFFDEPTFERDKPATAVSLLLQPTEPSPPSSASRPWLKENAKFEEIEMPRPTEMQSSISNDKTDYVRKSKLPHWIGIAAVAMLAVVAGPLSVYAPWQEKAIGPDSPFFGHEPALGLTGPLVGFPQPTSATNWRPANILPPKGPLQTKKTFPPNFVRVITPFDAVPQFGPGNTGVEFPPVVAIPSGPRMAPVAPRLALSMLERISGDPTSLVALPPVLAGISPDAIKPVPRPETALLTQ